MAPRWNQALVRIASAKDPSTLPTDDQVLTYDDRTITIFDKFAKARYHFLVLPRIPFKATSSFSQAKSDHAAPTLAVANGKLSFGATTSNNVPPSHMKSISSLLASPYAAEIVEALQKTSDRVVEHIRKDMQEQYGVTWAVERAFHAVPSMEHVHLHVVSMDLVSDRLKHKKHYLSFDPTLGFAVRLSAMEEMVKREMKSLPKTEHAYEQMLKGQLVSHHTGQMFKSFPELKTHLESYWRNTILAETCKAGGIETTNAQSQSHASGMELTATDKCAGSPEGRTLELGKRTAPSDSDEEPMLSMRR
ncbi:uncharacterized protein MEPE_03095 [Melanopsichium pennsylvanicum]|uniref:Aprataxin C2HE/C2H2/C2HC zinc finger domain-containing protein n=2 Tax=Melanopsichium pennsylvanicum TaxID=63383 RepID=A0AAJ4XMA1_9BASI|nr:hit-like protein [Melanopsichium pennsylvanicum 4]SNX84386.1 uncharacterized protein MEPE_03095 [Melanopsichium pennsylvanicum]